MFISFEGPTASVKLHKGRLLNMKLDFQSHDTITGEVK